MTLLIGIMKNLDFNFFKNHKTRLPHHSKKLIFLIFFGLFFFAAPALADETRTIRLKVAAFDQVLFDDNFIVQACPDSENGTNYTANGWCAVEQIVSSQGWNATSTWYSYGVMLNGINQYDGSDGNYWLWFSDTEPGTTALNQHILSDNEKLLLVFGTGPLKITASSVSPPINSTTTVNVFYFDAFAWQWSPAADSVFALSGQKIPSANGSYELWTATSSPYEITAKKPGFLDSNSITIVPQLPNINIKLRIETTSSTLADKNMTVWACEKNNGGGTYTLNGRCALDQSGLQTSWTDWGGDSFLDAIGDYSNNQNGNGIYWLWFNDLNYGQTSLNNHILTPDEELLLTYGKYPLRIQTATTTPYINGTSTLTLEQFGFDANWNAAWPGAATSTFVINGQEIQSADGSYSFLIATTTPYSVTGRKEGFLDSPVLILNSIAQNQETQNSQTGQAGGQESAPAGGGSGSGSTINNLPRSINVEKAVSFLSLNQKSDGSIGSSNFYSDWSAIALSAYGNNETKNKLKNYLIGAGYSINSNSRTTDLERRAMALMALGVNPYNGTATNFISEIFSAFDDTQIGDPNIFNDDIFALFPLLKAGYSGSDKIIEQTVKFILSKQDANGYWENTDLTAAAIQALALSLSSEGLEENLSDSVNQSLLKAKNALRIAQGQNGGFYDNIISTAWACQAITALGESASSWKNNGQSPLDFLALRQKSDGGFEEETAASDTRIWTTAYVIPAALNKTWDEILNNFPKPIQNSQNQNNPNLELGSLKINSTSTPPENPIPVPAISTSTPTTKNILTPQSATSTPASNQPQTTLKTPPPKPINSKLNLGKQKSLTTSELEFEEKKDNAINENQQNNSDKKNQPLDLTAQIGGIIPARPTQNNAAEIVFYLSGGITALIGLYLILKLAIFGR